MKRALALLVLAALPAHALTVEVVSSGYDGFIRRGRPAPLSVRVSSDQAWRGDFFLEGGASTHIFPLNLPPRGSAELRAWFVFVEAPSVAWRAGTEGGKLELNAKEPEPGEALVASERDAVGRRAEKYKMDFPPGSRFFFAEFPRDATPGMFAAVDAVVLKDRGADRDAFTASLPGLAAFRARGGAILWAGEAGKAWEGRLDPRDDSSWGEDAYAVLDRPAWAAGPRPYLGRLFGFALAPVLLSALAFGLVPGSARLRGGAAALILAAGTALAAFSAPHTLVSRESYALEFVRGAEADRLEITASTLPARGTPDFDFASGPDPEPIFFTRRDALERHVAIRHDDSHWSVLPGLSDAGSTLAVLRRTRRAVPGALRVEGASAINDSSRDLHGAFLVTGGRAAWIGELPVGASRLAEGTLKMSEVRSRLGDTPWRRMAEFWWRRADHAGMYLVGFAEEEAPADGEAALRKGLGVLVVVEVR